MVRSIKLTLHSSSCFCQRPTCTDHFSSSHHISSLHCIKTYSVRSRARSSDRHLRARCLNSENAARGSSILICFPNAMAPSLRGRLVCFYCGSKSDRTRTANIRSWQCKKCEAVNHLDEVRFFAISYLLCSLVDKILSRMARLRTLPLHQSPLPRLATLNQSNDLLPLSLTFPTIPSSARHV